MTNDLFRRKLETWWSSSRTEFRDHLDLAGEEYGRGKLATVLENCCGCPPDQIVRDIFADLDAFNTDRFDDQTLIVMRVK